jgi:branched-chain amino acid transport system permease protein
VDLTAVLGNALRAAFGPEAAIYALAAIGLNVHYGYTGLMNFGQVGFMLVGGYGLAISVSTFGLPLWVGLIVGILAALLLGLLLGLPTLRLRADYFAITTIAASEILRLLVRSLPASDLTGGVFGLQGFAGGFYALNPIPTGRYGIGLFSYPSGRLWPMLVSWAVVGLATLLVWRLTRSPWGRLIRSIREDEDAARSLGKDVFARKMQSVLLGGTLGGVAGILFVLTPNAANPDSFLPQVTFFAYAILILGGAATTFGPILGSVIFWFLVSGTDSLLREAAGAGLLPQFMVTGDAIGASRFVLVGAGLMLLMVFRPQGILGSKREISLGR